MGNNVKRLKIGYRPAKYATIVFPLVSEAIFLSNLILNLYSKNNRSFKCLDFDWLTCHTTCPVFYHSTSGLVFQGVQNLDIQWSGFPMASRILTYIGTVFEQCPKNRTENTQISYKPSSSVWYSNAKCPVSRSWLEFPTTKHTFTIKKPGLSAIWIPVQTICSTLHL